MDRGRAEPQRSAATLAPPSSRGAADTRRRSFPTGAARRADTTLGARTPMVRLVRRAAHHHEQRERHRGDGPPPAKKSFSASPYDAAALYLRHVEQGRCSRPSRSSPAPAEASDSTVAAPVRVGIEDDLARSARPSAESSSCWRTRPVRPCWVTTGCGLIQAPAQQPPEYEKDRS